jgi:mannose-6-phosphate isomerase-like protein (cupin superfamily)
MQLFEQADLLAAHTRAGHAYHEFLRVPALSCGIYVIPAGGIDPQQPHSEDEIYFVLEGTAQVVVGEESQLVQPGSLVYVPAHVPHRFTDVATDLKLLVLFAPAEATG